MTCTDEQLTALRLFAAANGRKWKSELSTAWMTGRYRDYDLGGADSAVLQGIRNQFGPSWLVRFKLPSEPSQLANIR